MTDGEFSRSVAYFWSVGVFAPADLNEMSQCAGGAEGLRALCTIPAWLVAFIGASRYLITMIPTIRTGCVSAVPWSPAANRHVRQGNECRSLSRS